MQIFQRQCCRWKIASASCFLITSCFCHWNTPLAMLQTMWLAAKVPGCSSLAIVFYYKYLHNTELTLESFNIYHYYLMGTLDRFIYLGIIQNIKYEECIFIALGNKHLEEKKINNHKFTQTKKLLQSHWKSTIWIEHVKLDDIWTTVGKLHTIRWTDLFPSNF